MPVAQRNAGVFPVERSRVPTIEMLPNEMSKFLFVFQSTIIHLKCDILLNTQEGIEKQQQCISVKET